MNWLRRCSIPALVVILSLCGLALSGPGGNAQPPAAEKWLLDRSLTLTPEPEPRAALAYRLFPLVSERIDGNAVPIYLRLAHEQPDASRREWAEKPLPWNAGPIDKMPLEDARAFLKTYARFLRQFELGARRKRADWNYTLDQGSVIDILLPDVQMMRTYMPMLLLKARVELADGNFAAAAHWLETGFAFSRHIGNGPFLINRLVGIAGCVVFADGVLDFVSRPDAPNLYWSLTALPRPLIDLRDAMEFEYKVLEGEFPELADLERPRSPEQWNTVLKNVRTQYQLLIGADRESGADKGLTPRPGNGPTDPASQSPDLPAARKYLAEQKKLAADKIEAMPPAQVLLLYFVDAFREFRDDTFKTAYLPPTQAMARFAEAQARLKAAPTSAAKQFAEALLPAIGKVQLSQLRLERRIAALRVIEALRMHAAAHDGQLPDRLSDVTIVPVPNDPGTDQAFEYRRDGRTATLIGRMPGQKLETTGVRYRLVMKQR